LFLQVFQMAWETILDSTKIGDNVIFTLNIPQAAI
jgi:hypothetical protein